FMKHVTENQTPEQMIARFRDLPPNFEPGAGWAYCNSGYFLLGEIAGQAAGKPYGELLRERVFASAGMTHTGRHRPGLNLPDEARGYSRSGDQWKPSVDWNMSQAGGAGEIYSTVGDLFRWNEAIFNGKALSDASLKKAHTPVNVQGSSELGGMGKDYGYGWVIGEKRGLKAIWHNGGLDGFSSELLRFPGLKVTIAALANTMTPASGMSPNEAIDLAARLFLWQDMKPQPCVHETSLPDGVKLADYSGTFDFITVGVMRFCEKDGRLQGKLAAQQWGDLQPAGKDIFREPGVDATFEFQRDDKGAITKVKLLQHGFNIAGARYVELKEGKLEPAKLAELAGTYDLGIGKFVLRVKQKGGALAGHLGEQPEFDFVPVESGQDHLFSHAIRVDLEFKRNGEGEITEMILHQNGLNLPGKRESR
ncbi:MAG TPA: serine hydrolase domain-containing protein, partial [Verrucomicrobiaceae bacterium]